jgi:hypothetical protein
MQSQLLFGPSRAIFIPRMRKKHKIFSSDRDIARLKELWNQDLTLEVIAVKFRCSIATVWLHARKQGLRLRQRRKIVYGAPNAGSAPRRPRRSARQSRSGRALATTTHRLGREGARKRADAGYK